ncbi:phosphoribosyltransferase family protein [Kitasatospora azatica]|uniref:phosphoribosyltransferase family protein n=1 Tax=Kitasatospora azatica TaxID=58347 RepID=UPI000565532C|nr:phosphoribosyltransferase family protein [Kitasatospora azatica]
MNVINARKAVLEHFRWDGGHADVWSVFRDGPALAATVRALVEPFRSAGVTAVAGVESRGFLLGAAAAIELGVGFVAVRKAAGLLPGPKLSRDAEPVDCRFVGSSSAAGGCRLVPRQPPPFATSQPSRSDYLRPRHTLRLQRSALCERDRVLLVDDWIETGSQAAAVRELVRECGAGWAGCAVIVDQLTGGRRPALGPIHGLLRADQLPAVPGS